MADLIPTSFKADLGKANISWLTDTFKIMLLTSTAAPAATWAKRSDVTNEVVGTGYTAGGATLITPVITASGTTQQYSAANPSWPNATITARYAAIYKARGGAATADELVAIYDFVTDKISTNGNFGLNFSANGCFTLG
ncbi:MAG: hypothetical protein H0X33_13165 [Taibaiella sp.]|nr:hypothetical protein [Taibaiella sp.]